MRPSGTVTFLFTDIEGSTASWESDPSGMARSLARHDEILTAAVERHAGVVFSFSGDGFAAAFSRAADALMAALESQQALQSKQWTDGPPVRVRMGVHTGEVEERDGNYFGPALNCAARLMGAAHGGQLVVSEVTAALLPRRDTWTLLDLGLHRLKGIAEPMRVFGVQAEGLVGVERRLNTSAVTGNLPVLLTSFVGRQDEIARLSQEVVRRRLITLTGTGGVGKTRLAVEVSHAVAESFADGAWLADLTAVSDPTAVVHVVASALGIPLPNVATAVDALVDSLTRSRLLLVLDNCEHVLGATVELVDRVLAAGGGVHVVATSRELLGLAGERVWPVDALDARAEGVELFYDRAALVGGPVMGADRPVVENICERLEGIPLAIELAAARTRTLPLAELLVRLDDRLGVLRKQGRRVDRHDTLRTTIDWSYRLLGEEERCLFDRLGCFAGTFDRAAAETVCGFEPLDPLDVDDLLAFLVDRSMLVVDRSGPTARFRLLETVREFANERLRARMEDEVVRDRHLAHYLAVSEDADRRWRSPGVNDAHDVFVREWDNLRTAGLWAVASEDAEAAVALVTAIGSWAGNSGIRPEGAEWTAEALRLAERGGRVSAPLLGLAGIWARQVGEDQLGITLADRGLALLADPEGADSWRCWAARCFCSFFAGGNDNLVADALALVRALENRGDPFELVQVGVYTLLVLDADAVSDQAALFTDVAGQLRNPVTDAAAAYASVVERWRHHDLEVALANLEDAVTLARHARHGALLYNSVLIGLVVRIERAQHDTRVQRDLRQFLQRARFIPNPWTHRWLVIHALAAYLGANGVLEPAAVLVGALERHHPAVNPLLENAHGVLMERIGADAGARTAMDYGERLTPEQALDYATQLLDGSLLPA
jgi:predicted ATPase/class 3 adenylate cyclase